MLLGGFAVPARISTSVSEHGPGLVHTQGFESAVSESGLRCSGRNSAERDLLARLELTGFQRSIKRLLVVRHPSSTGTAFLFANTVAGIGVGLAEGAMIRTEGVDLAAWARAIAAASGCNILSLATPTTGDLPDRIKSQVISHEQFADRTVTRVRMRFREVLRLGADYETTLAGLGRHTRRNIRNARKQALADGLTFSFHEGRTPLSSRQLKRLAQRTQPMLLDGYRRRRFERFVDHTARPFRSVIRTKDGAPVSYCCGFLDGEVGYLVYQLNDDAFHHLGPSLMHRAFLIEALLTRGCRELVFVHGCSGVLRYSCIPVIVDHYWVMHRSRIARLSAMLLARLQPDLLLGQLAKEALAVSQPQTQTTG